MDTHKNAPLTPKSRGDGAAAHQFNTTAKTVAKWIERFRAEGVDGLRDRSSRPHSLPSQTPPATCAAVEALRRQRHTGKQIAAEVGVSAATVSRILRRLGLNRLSALEPAELIRRYQRENPGELIHIDIKKPGKFNRIGHRITGVRPWRLFDALHDVLGIGQSSITNSLGKSCDGLFEPMHMAEDNESVHARALVADYDPLHVALGRRRRAVSPCFRLLFVRLPTTATVFPGLK